MFEAGPTNLPPPSWQIQTVAETEQAAVVYIGDADRRAVVAAAVDTLQWWLWRRPTSIGCGGGQHSGGGCRQAVVAAYKL